MARIRKWTLLCGIAALLAVGAWSPVARADEARFQDKTVTEGNRGRRGGGRRGGRHHGSGWGWAGFGAAVGLGVLSAVTNDSPRTYYVEPAPSYQVVYPSTTYYYHPAPVRVQRRYVQPRVVQRRYVQPNYGQVYVTPAQPAPPAPCNVCP